MIYRVKCELYLALKDYTIKVVYRCLILGLVSEFYELFIPGIITSHDLTWLSEKPMSYDE